MACLSQASTLVYPRQDLSLKAGYTYNHASDRSSGRATDKLANVPEHKLDAVAQYTIPYSKTRLDLSGSYMGKIYTKLPTPTKNQAEAKIGGFTVFNARISQKFMNHYEAYLAVNNLLDKNYAMSYAGSAGLPGPGRNILGGITASF